MSTFENGFEMIYKSKTVKVISFSVLGFCAGLCLTWGVIATRNGDTLEDDWPYFEDTTIV